MSPFLLALLYTGAVLFAVGFYGVYLPLSSVRGDEREIRLLEGMELHLAQILPLLEAPDVQMLMATRQSRQSLFLDFSSYLKEDVLALIRSGRLDVQTLILACFFLRATT